MCLPLNTYYPTFATSKTTSKRLMKTKFLWISLFCSILLLSSIRTWADPIDRKGGWNEKDYRTAPITPPMLYIEGNVLSVQFVDALTDLSIQIQDSQGMILYEDVINGERGEVYPISLDGFTPGTYQILLTHKLGWITGEFTIQ